MKVYIVISQCAYEGCGLPEAVFISHDEAVKYVADQVKGNTDFTKREPIKDNDWFDDVVDWWKSKYNDADCYIVCKTTR